MLCFVLINGVLLNILCVWICFGALAVILVTEVFKHLFVSFENLLIIISVMCMPAPAEGLLLSPKPVISVVEKNVHIYRTAGVLVTLNNYVRVI